MLKNELNVLTLIVSELLKSNAGNKCGFIERSGKAISCRIIAVCSAIREAFTEAIFSDVPDHALHRYFDFHLKGISAISDALQMFSKECNDQGLLKVLNDAVLSLIDFAQNDCSAYFNSNLYAPFYWHERLNSSINNKAELLLSRFSVAHIDDTLKGCVVAYLEEMSEAGSRRFSYSSLIYYKQFVNTLSIVCPNSDETEQILSNLLVEINFNHLQFLAYKQNLLRNKCNAFNSTKLSNDFLRLERDKVDYLHQDTAPSCFPQWPSLKIMIGKWIVEELALVEKQALDETLTPIALKQEKISLDLPVAYIACLIRLFQEENVFGTTSISEVFRFVAKNYSSKRQPMISAGGLSKEYYSINQVTAARVQDMLKNMVQRISRNFFPLLAVTSLITQILKETY